jgi:hypothetical protein
MFIANFKQPVGLVQALTQVGVSQSYVHLRMLKGEFYDVSRCVVIIYFEAVQNRIHLELGCIVMNDRYEVIGESFRTCILATAQDSYAQGMVGVALPYVPKNGRGKSAQFAAAVGQVTASEKESVRASFFRFLELCLGGDYIKVNMFAKPRSVKWIALCTWVFRILPDVCRTCVLDQMLLPCFYLTAPNDLEMIGFSTLAASALQAYVWHTQAWVLVVMIYTIVPWKIVGHILLPCSSVHGVSLTQPELWWQQQL